MTIEPENLPDDITALQAALAAEREARQQAEARASSAEALVAHYKLVIAKLKREQYGQSSERGPQLARSPRRRRGHPQRSGLERRFLRQAAAALHL